MIDDLQDDIPDFNNPSPRHLVRAEASRQGVDPNLAERMMNQESSGRQSVVSPKGARGIMQLMPGTARGLGVNPRDPYQNVRGGVTYLKQQLDRFGDPRLAAAAYNAGPGAVAKAGNRVPRIKETQRYVKNVAPDDLPDFSDEGLPDFSAGASNPRAVESKAKPGSRKPTLAPAYRPVQPAAQAETPGGQPAERANQDRIASLGNVPNDGRTSWTQKRSKPSFAQDVAARRQTKEQTYQAEPYVAERRRQANEEAHREAANRAIGADIGGRIGLPGVRLPRIVTETMADVGSRVVGDTGAAISGITKPGLTGGIIGNIPGASSFLEPVNRLGEYLQEQGQQTAEAGAPEGVRKDIGQAVGALLPMLIARRPLAVGALTYTQARGRGASEAEATKEGAIAAATVGAMGKGADLVGRAIPGQGILPAAGRFLGRAGANVAAGPIIEAPIRAAEGRDILPTTRELASKLPMDVGFAAMPHQVGPSRDERRAYQSGVESNVPRPPQRLALNPAPPEALASTPRGPFDVGPNGEAIMAQRTSPPRVLEPIPTQAIPLNRYQRRAQDARNVQQEVGSGRNRMEQQSPTLHGGDRAGVESLNPQPQGQPPAEVAQRPESVVSSSRVPVPQSDVQTVGTSGPQGPQSGGLRPVASSGRQPQTIELTPEEVKGASPTPFQPPQAIDSRAAAQGDITSSVAGRVARSLTRNFRAGMNDGVMTFVDETHRDLYDLGAKIRFAPSGKVNQRGVGDVVGLSKSMAQRLGIPESEVAKRALDVHTDVKAQMKGVKHLEERRLVDNTAPKPLVTMISPSVPIDRSVKPERDTLLAAIQKIGFDSTTPEGADLARYLSVKEGGRPGMVNKQRLAGGQKRGVDELITALQEHGWDIADKNDLMEAVRYEQRGRPVHSNAYDHAAHAESELVAVTQAHRDSQTKTDAEKSRAVFGDDALSPIVEKLGTGEYTDADWNAFEEAARYQHGLSEEAIDGIREEAASNRANFSQRERDSERVATGGAQTGEQAVSSAERETGQREGDVDAATIRQANEAARAGQSAVEPPGSGMGQRAVEAGRLPTRQVVSGRSEPDVPHAPSEPPPSTDQLSRVSSILEDLKSQSKETGQNLTSLVEDRINQRALPGMEQAAELTSTDAAMLRDLAKPAARRGANTAQQSALLETGPTIDSKAEGAKQAEAAQAEAAANAPLFEGNRPVAKEPWQMTRAEYGLNDPNLSSEAFDRLFMSHRRAVMEAVAEGKPVPPEILRGYSDLVSHHSQTQARDDVGKFTLEPPTPEPAKGSHGQFINALFKSPDVDRGIPAFWANPEVRAKLGLPRTGPMSESKDALAKAVGKPRSSHLSPDDVRQWASDNGLSQDALTALDAGEAQYKAYQRRIEAQKKGEGGFLRLGRQTPAERQQERLIKDAALGVGPAGKDFTLRHKFVSPLSNLNFRGSYERIGGELGQRASEAFRQTQIDIANKAITSEGGLLRLKRQIGPIKRQLIEAGKPGLAEELGRHVDRIGKRDQSFSGVAGRLKSVQYNLKLRYNIKSATLNMLQPLNTLWPYVSTPEFARLYSQALRPSVRKAISERLSNEAGVKVEGQVEASKRRLPDPFGAASDTNRVMGYLYGMKEAGRMGLKGDKAERHAADWAKKVEFDNSEWDVPPILSGPMASVIGQFKGFTIKNIESIVNDLRKHEDDKFGGWAARAGKRIAAQIAIGGARSIPGVKGVGRVLMVGALAKAIQQTGVDEDKANKMAEAVYYGAPSLIGEDLSGSMMVLDPPFGDNVYQQIVNFVGGPTVGMAARLTELGQDAYNAQSGEERKEIARKAANVVTPYTRAAEVGLQYAKGEPPTVRAGGKDVELNHFEAVMRAIGFTPVKQTRGYEMKDADKSEGEKAAKAAAVKAFGGDSKPKFQTAEDKAARTAKQEFVDLVRAKSPQAIAKAEAMLASGQVSEKELETAYKRAKFSDDGSWDMSQAPMELMLDIAGDAELMKSFKPKEQQEIYKVILDRVDKLDSRNYRPADFQRVKSKALKTLAANADEMVKAGLIEAADVPLIRQAAQK